MALPNKGFIAGALAGVGVAATAVAGVGLALPSAQAQERVQRAAAAPIFAPSPGGVPSFADIFERVSPAVVSITVTARVPRSELQQQLPFPFNQMPQFRQGPGGRGGQGGGGGGSGPGLGSRRGPDGRPLAPNGDTNGDGEDDALPEAQAAGSGFFVSPEGYIVTNNHVIENATKITVTLTDKRELTARLIGRDEDSDLAVIKVDGANFPSVQFETQAKPRVGDWVLAVGNPLQLGGTATAGIVSAIGRDLPPDSAGSLPAEYLQIDAPINRGNSGGPTFDSFGRVIGVNTAIYSSTGGSIGIGFAVPADTANNVVKELIAGRRITRGYLGASITNVGTEQAEALGLPQNAGALIAELTAGGPGARAGLQVGDIVLSINGQKINGSSELTRTVARTRAGDVMRLEVRRGGQVRTVNVTSGTRPSVAQLNGQLGSGDDASSSRGGSDRQAPAPEAAIGLSVRPLDEAGRQENRIGQDVRGLIITNVAQGSDAFRKGLRTGMVIVQANERPVTTAAEFAAAVADARRAGRPSVFLLINVGNAGNRGVAVKLDGPSAPVSPNSGPSRPR